MIKRELDSILDLISSFPSTIKDAHFNSGQSEETFNNLQKECVQFYNDIKKEFNELSRIEGKNFPLRIGVVGGFSTGKSTMINSILDTNLLGVNVKPATARTTEIVYGSDLRFQKILKNGNVEYINKEEFDQLSNHEYKGKKPQIDNLDSFRIEVPSSILKHISIIDTPGFFSTSVEDDALTMERLKDMHLILWNFDIEKVGGKDEINLLQKISNKKIIGVLNKADNKAPNGREKQREHLLATCSFFEDVIFYSSSKVLKYREQREKHKRDLHDLLKRIKNHTKGKNADFSFSSNGYFFQHSPENVFDLQILQENDFTKYHDELLFKIEKIRKEEIDKQCVESVKQRKIELFELIQLIISFLNSKTEKYIHNCSEEINSLELKEQNIFPAIVEQKEKLKIRMEFLYKSVFDKTIATVWKNLFQQKIENGFFSKSYYLEKAPSSGRTVEQLLSHFGLFNKEVSEFSNYLLKEKCKTPMRIQVDKEIKKTLSNITAYSVRIIFSEHIFEKDKYDALKDIEIIEKIKMVFPHREIKKTLFNHHLKVLEAAFFVSEEENRNRRFHLSRNLVLLNDLLADIKNTSILFENKELKTTEERIA